MKKKTIIVHSDGIDLSLCLAVAIKKFSPRNVLSISFKYG